MSIVEVLNFLNPKNSKYLKQYTSITEVIEDFKWTARKCEWIANSFLGVAAFIVFFGVYFYGYPESAERALRLKENKEVIPTFNPEWQEKGLQAYIQIRKIAFMEAVARRVGIIVLILFLVQVLVRTYRYNKRISNFYNSRAQSLEYIAIKGGNLADLLNALKFFSTDYIDVGLSRTPTDTIADAVKKTSSNAG